MKFTTLWIVVACILFILAAWPPANNKVNLLAVGLFFFALFFAWPLIG